LLLLKLNNSGISQTNLLTLLVLDSVLQDMGELIRKYLQKKRKEIENVANLKLPSPVPDIDNNTENCEQRRKTYQMLIFALSSWCGLGQNFDHPHFCYNFILMHSRSEIQTLDLAPASVQLIVSFTSVRALLHLKTRHMFVVLCILG